MEDCETEDNGTMNAHVIEFKDNEHGNFNDEQGMIRMKMTLFGYCFSFMYSKLKQEWIFCKKLSFSLMQHIPKCNQWFAQNFTNLHTNKKQLVGGYWSCQ